MTTYCVHTSGVSDFALILSSSEDLMSRLIRISQRGDLESVKEMIELYPPQDPQWADAHGQFGAPSWTNAYDSGMWWASYGGHLEVVKFLFSVGDGTIKKDVMTAAIARKRIQVIKFLIISGSPRFGLKKFLNVKSLPRSVDQVLAVIDMYQVNNE